MPRAAAPRHNGAVARRRPGARGSRRGRPGLLESLVESAGELVQSVANEVVPPVVDAVDVDELVQRIDFQAVLDRVDLNELLEKVDLDQLVERLDVGRLIERIDVDAVLANVDLNALLEKVDIDAILARTELGAVMARSGGAVASRTLDVMRSQGVGLDAFVERWTNRLLRRHDPLAATGPPRLVAKQGLATS
jgi:hypothetical protein